MSTPRIRSTSRPTRAWLTIVLPALMAPPVRAAAPASVVLTENAVDESAGGLVCYRVETPAATYYLEKSGAGLSSLIDREGNDWLGFHPQAGSGAAGEYRGFPNAVNQKPRGETTDPVRIGSIVEGLLRQEPPKR